MLFSLVFNIHFNILKVFIYFFLHESAACVLFFNTNQIPQSGCSVALYVDEETTVLSLLFMLLVSKMLRK